VRRQHIKLYAPGTAGAQLCAISRVSDSAPSNHYQAAALDAAQQLGPAGQLTTPAQSHASTRWKCVLQQQQDASSTLHASAAKAVKVDNLMSQHKVPQHSMHAVTAAAAGQRHIHAAFGAFFGYLTLMAAATTNPDWYLDVFTFGGLWAILWAVCAR
jgi:hypothetical protein